MLGRKWHFLPRVPAQTDVHSTETEWPGHSVQHLQVTEPPRPLLPIPPRAAVPGYLHFNHFTQGIMLAELVGSAKLLRTN